MKIRKILLISLAAAALLGIGLGISLRKTVNLSVDGQVSNLTTYTLTVGGFLKEQNIPIGEEDSLNLPLNRWLKNRESVRLTRAIPIQIWVDGQLLSFTSSERSPRQLFIRAGVIFGPGDQILSQGLPYPLEQLFPEDCKAISLQIKRAMSFSLSDGGKTYTYTSNASTLGAALWDAGVKYLEGDRLEPPAATPLKAGLAANLKRGRPVIISTLTGEIESYTTAETVGEALLETSMALQGLDYSLPSPEAAIPQNNEIRVVQVREEVIIEQTPLPFETQYQPVADLEIDNQTIIQTGEYGLTAHRVRVRYEDEIEISRHLESEWVVQQPKDRIIGYGTQIVLHTAVVDGMTVEYWRSLTMWATSYYPAETSNTTASGLPLQKGVAAVDIRYIPFYTRMYIPGYGEAIAADTGGGVIGRWIDLGYSNEDYVSWHAYVTVYFLWPPPDNIVYIIP